MDNRRYRPPSGHPVPLAEYHQSKDELAGLPQALVEKVPVTSTSNIFSYKSYTFAKDASLRAALGVGGHVVAADEVKSVIAKFVLVNNGYREPIFILPQIVFALGAAA